MFQRSQILCINIYIKKKIKTSSINHFIFFNCFFFLLYYRFLIPIKHIFKTKIKQHTDTKHIACNNAELLCESEVWIFQLFCKNFQKKNSLTKALNA